MHFIQRNAHTTNSDFKNYSSESSRGAARLTTLSPESFISPLGIGLQTTSSQRYCDSAELRI